jgi:hypothetical protein
MLLYEIIKDICKEHPLYNRWWFPKISCRQEHGRVVLIIETEQENEIMSFVEDYSNQSVIYGTIWACKWCGDSLPRFRDMTRRRSLSASHDWCLEDGGRIRIDLYDPDSIYHLRQLVDIRVRAYVRGHGKPLTRFFVWGMATFISKYRMWRDG